METAVQFERGVAGIGVFHIVISKFRYRQQPSPVILLIVDEGPEIGLHRAFLFLCLAICLRLESG